MNKFIGFDSELNQADLVFLGIPFDGTSSFRPGSRFAPYSARFASQGLETYSPYQDKDVCEKNICDLGDLELPFGNTQKTMQIIEDSVDDLLRNQKKVISCGGEHLVSYPIIKSYLIKYPNLVVIHLDAHTDIRDSYLGEELSHASIIKLIAKQMNPKNIYQFGIRSGEKYEFEWGQQNTNFYPFSLQRFPDALAKIAKDIPVYLTLDLDILDPAYFPGTGTPEPGGVSFNELLSALLLLKDHNIVGADVVELAPDYDHSGVSNITTAKLIREIAMMIL